MGSLLIEEDVSTQPSTTLKPRKIVRVVSDLPARLLGAANPNPDPQECLASILSSQGICYKVYSYNSLPVQGFFQETKQEEIDSYGLDVLTAVRESDIEQLRVFHNKGRPLKSSNRFGESILHLACRRGLTHVVEFLVHEANMPLNVLDDMGRSPLHDAFWAPEPNFAIVDLILTKFPDLLYIGDKRGHTPLSYTRGRDWGKWAEYLKRRQTAVWPKVLLLFEPSASSSREASYRRGSN
jgi:hypothetical protein